MPHIASNLRLILVAKHINKKMSIIQFLVHTNFREEATFMDFQKDSASLCSKGVGNTTSVIRGNLKTSLAHVAI